MYSTILIVFVNLLLTVITFTTTNHQYPSKDGVCDQFHDHHLLKTFVDDKLG